MNEFPMFDNSVTKPDFELERVLPRYGVSGRRELVGTFSHGGLDQYDLFLEKFCFLGWCLTRVVKGKPDRYYRYFPHPLPYPKFWVRHKARRVLLNEAKDGEIVFRVVKK